ncbi:histidine kinase [Flammeovirgaceae bacterium SG7u.111]|nr:histidine kinase [Flammeovirgaceae bacterium SG7u.132]WPO37178.1 histidine kinase [Flammeovirgaceae bacterium SG7u.111]
MGFLKKNRLAFIELVIIIFVWFLLLVVPVLFGDFQDDVNWGHILKQWKEYSLLFVAFLINHLLLLPFLFFKGKRIAYFGSAVVLIIMLFGSMYLNYEQVPKPPYLRRSGERIERNMERPPNERNIERERSPSERNMERERPSSERGRSKGPMPPMRGAIPPYANLLILSILIIGFDTGLSISIKWVKSEQERVELEKESTENKLAFLKNQVSPHFFMNTLNNIHALVDINSEEAKESIIKLSRLMGYLLYESQTDLIPLQKEIQFINSYVELMKLRFTDQVSVDLLMPQAESSVSIPPLLFISFIENAFKYGISYQNPSYVRIIFKLEKERLYFEIENSVHGEREKQKNSGLGIENTQKRLELIYGSGFDLKLDDAPSSFNVKLNIPV